MDTENRVDSAFESFRFSFERIKNALGLSHYHVSFVRYQDNKSPNYAEIEVDSEDCVATVTLDPARLYRDRVVHETAAHEIVHLLLADLKHAIEFNPKAARMEEERIARRLEPILAAAVK